MCTSPPEVANGYVAYESLNTGPTWSAGEYVFYKCFQYYALVDSDRQRCDGPLWSGTLPKCEYHQTTEIVFWFLLTLIILLLLLLLLILIFLCCYFCKCCKGSKRDRGGRDEEYGRRHSKDSVKRETKSRNRSPGRQRDGDDKSNKGCCTGLCGSQKKKEPRSGESTGQKHGQSSLPKRSKSPKSEGHKKNGCCSCCYGRNKSKQQNDSNEGKDNENSDEREHVQYYNAPAPEKSKKLMDTPVTVDHSPQVYAAPKTQRNDKNREEAENRRREEEERERARLEEIEKDWEREQELLKQKRENERKRKEAEQQRRLDQERLERERKEQRREQERLHQEQEERERKEQEERDQQRRELERVEREREGQRAKAQEEKERREVEEEKLRKIEEERIRKQQQKELERVEREREEQRRKEQERLRKIEEEKEKEQLRKQQEILEQRRQQQMKTEQDRLKKLREERERERRKEQERLERENEERQRRHQEEKEIERQRREAEKRAKEQEEQRIKELKEKEREEEQETLRQHEEEKQREQQRKEWERMQQEREEQRKREKEERERETLQQIEADREMQKEKEREQQEKELERFKQEQELQNQLRERKLLAEVERKKPDTAVEKRNPHSFARNMLSPLQEENSQTFSPSPRSRRETPVDKKPVSLINSNDKFLRGINDESIGRKGTKNPYVYIPEELTPRAMPKSLEHTYPKHDFYQNISAGRSQDADDRNPFHLENSNEKYIKRVLDEDIGSKGQNNPHVYTPRKPLPKKKWDDSFEGMSPQQPELGQSDEKKQRKLINSNEKYLRGINNDDIGRKGTKNPLVYRPYKIRDILKDIDSL